MIAALPDMVLLTFLLFCRIGGCLMLMPGFASSRVPVRVRLFIAIAVTLALAPLLLPTLKVDPSPARTLEQIISETATGTSIGLMGRFFFLALQFMTTAVAMWIGFSALPEPSIDETEPAPALANFMTLTATVLFFLTGLHWEVLRALVASYEVLPMSDGFSAQQTLVDLTRNLAIATGLALQITTPFIVYSIAINFLFGLVNKLIPQIPVYFISVPFVVAGGLLLFLLLFNEILTLFTEGFASWLARG